MSHNPSRADRSDSTQYKRTGRSGGSNQQRQFQGSASSKGGGGAPFNAPPVPLPMPKQHVVKKDVGVPNQTNAGEVHSVSKSKRDIQLSSAPPVTQNQKPAVHSIPGMPMQMPFHQPQVPLQFGGPNPQIQPRAMSGTSMPLPMQMPLPIGNPTMQQPMFISGLQPHPMPSQGMMQGQNFSFPPQMTHQLPPQMGNMGINMTLQFPQQQAGKYGGSRKTVKITHPETHEKLRLDGSHGPRSHPVVTPQSQPNPAFPPNHQMNFYTNSYNGNPIYYPASSSVPLNSTQVLPTSQPPRFYNQVTVKAPLGAHGEKEPLPATSSVSVRKAETSEPEGSVTKISQPRGKKKKKELYRKAQAAGTSSDLDIAYKGPEENKGAATSKESVEETSSNILKQTSSEISQESDTSSENPPLSKAEPDDWEDAAEISPQLERPKNENQGSDVDANELMTKRYSRDFLLKFVEQCTDLPKGFEINHDIADSLLVSSFNMLHESYPSPGRNIDRPVGGSRPETSEPEGSVAKISQPRGKKKKKELYRKAQAAGTSSDLDNAYKGPEENKGAATSKESVEETSSNILKQTSSEISQESDTSSENPPLSKAEPDDWEDAAEISPQLERPKNENQGSDVDANELMTKRYSRDFLLKFVEQCTDLPKGFEINHDIADSLLVSSFNMIRESYPSPGRNIDRPAGGSRLDRRAGGYGDEDIWNKFPVQLMSGRGDARADIGYVGNVVGFRPDQAGNYGVLRNPQAQTPIQYAGGILSGPMKSLSPQGVLLRNNSDSDRGQRGTAFQKGLMPPPQTPPPPPVMHKAEKKYEVDKVTDEEQAKQRQLKGILNKLTPQNFEKLFQQVKQVNIDNVVTLSGVISQIFDKALTEPTFCEMYADFCFHLATDLPELSVDNEKITFKRLLRNKCQEEFERGEREVQEANEGESKQTEEERKEKRVRVRRRMFGSIRLIGELYEKKMLSKRIMHECVKKLLGQDQNPDEEK